MTSKSYSHTLAFSFSSLGCFLLEVGDRVRVAGGVGVGWELRSGLK